MMHGPETYSRIDHFVRSTRTAVFVREADQLLMIRPDKTMGINRTAAAILSALYQRDAAPAAELLPKLAPRLGVETPRLVADTDQLITSLGAILNEDFSPRPGLVFGSFDRSMVQYPTLAEIALTYGCQNRCAFCYASSPDRAPEKPTMSTEDIKRVMEKIYSEAHVPSLSFTGGEATLHRDLPELIAHGVALGFRINLITNGIRAADMAFARRLVEAGLASAQISLEAADAALHDHIVGRPGAFARTVAGVENFKALGIHVHTNTTLCSENLGSAADIVRFVGQKLRLSTLSMNMVIRTGEALGERRIGVTYSEVAPHLPELMEVARQEGVRFVWYSPIPYCIANPVLLGLGAKSCACVDGILSVDPTGQVLPCSSFETGIGSLKDEPFEKIFRNRQARYWRKKKFVPPMCEECSDVDVCAGACPLYWDASESFAEIPRPGSDDLRLKRRWEKRRQQSKSFGVRPTPRGK